MGVDRPNRAAAAIVFGGYLALARGGRLTKVKPGNMFVVSGPVLRRREPPLRPISALLAAVSGQKADSPARRKRASPAEIFPSSDRRSIPDEPFVITTMPRPA
jgi:hypothetical protein